MLICNYALLIFFLERGGGGVNSGWRGGQVDEELFRGGGGSGSTGGRVDLNEEVELYYS